MDTKITMVCQPGDQLVNYPELVSIAKKSGGKEQVVDDNLYVTGGGLTLITNKSPEGVFPDQHESSTTLGSDAGSTLMRALVDDTLRGVDRDPTAYRWGMGEPET